MRTGRLLVLSLILSLTAAWGLAGCDPCACVNACARSYELGPELGSANMRVQGHVEGAMDCELAELPLSLPVGEVTTIARIEGRSASIFGDLYTVSITRTTPGLDANACGDVSPDHQGIVEALHALALPVGTSICVLDHVAAVVSCTQKGCGF